MNYLQQISSAVSLDVARRLFMKECEVKKAEGQEREWAAVGYSQCRNIAQMLEEVSYNDGDGMTQRLSYGRGAESQWIMEMQVCEIKDCDGNRQTLWNVQG